MNETIFNDLYDFVAEMSPDKEMCFDYCVSQGITINPEVIDVIDDMLWNYENDSNSTEY